MANSISFTTEIPNFKRGNRSLCGRFFEATHAVMVHVLEDPFTLLLTDGHRLFGRLAKHVKWSRVRPGNCQAISGQQKAEQDEQRQTELRVKHSGGGDTPLPFSIRVKTTEPLSDKSIWNAPTRWLGESTFLFHPQTFETDDRLEWIILGQSIFTPQNHQASDQIWGLSWTESWGFPPEKW
jgi:hypothetical protein